MKLPAEMPPDLNASINFLREFILGCAPAGPGGFEGLVASALASETALVFRLANSGSQFGRDARSERGPFSIAIEAKRYDTKLNLQNLAGKAAQAGFFLRHEVDLWVLCTTETISEGIEEHLSQMLEEYGISFLALDWTLPSLPHLAVLLAAASQATLQWFGQYRTEADLSRLENALQSIRSDIAFPHQFQQLKDKLNSAEIGLDSLRARNNEWLRRRLKDRGLSQRTFNQYLAVADPSIQVTVRSTLLNSLSKMLDESLNEPTTIAIVGDEGTGKSWLIAQWLASQTDLPIVLLVAGRHSEHLDPGKPLETIARLIVEQVGPSYNNLKLESWVRRLQRWKQQKCRGQFRFMVVLDGLNERPTEPWSDIVKCLSSEIQELGGILLITTRQAFWKRDLAPALSSDFPIQTLLVPGYADEELASALDPVRTKPEGLSPRVREFLRNPRVCSIAGELLARLSLDPGDLSIERLLIEYWRRRMEERGSLLAHNVDDFHKVLRSHAKAWLEQPHRSFDRDDWATHSGAAKRVGLPKISNDLTEIEEGRFLAISPSDRQSYQFRKETLPFALALFITNELSHLPVMDDATLSESLKELLEPVQGFDLVADIVAAAVALACLDKTFQASIRKSLLLAFYGLQNVSTETTQTVVSYLPCCPDAFLDALEAPELERNDIHRQMLILDALRAASNQSGVRAALRLRLPYWLSCWSLHPRRHSTNNLQERWVAEDESRMRTALAQLTPSEKLLFEKLCQRVDNAPVHNLNHAAPLFLSGHEQAEFAEALVAWAIASGVVRGPFDTYKDLAWCVRLNRLDFEQTESAILKHLEKIEASSEPMKRGVALALRLLGTHETSMRAEQIVPSVPLRFFRRVEQFCDTDPHDPESPIGSNIDNSRAVIGKTDIEKIWNHMSNTVEDADLHTAMPSLARFDPVPLMAYLRRLVCSLSSRTGLSLRQLAWRLPTLSPIFDEKTVDTIMDSIPSMPERAETLPTRDVTFVVGEALAAVLPHVDGEKQIQILMQMPEGIPQYLFLRHSMRDVNPEILERLLIEANEANNIAALKWILFHASGSSPVFTERAGDIAISLLYHPDQALAACAADAIYVAEDPRLHRLLLSEAQQHHFIHIHQREPYRDRAITRAVVAERRLDLLHLVAPARLGEVADSLRGSAMDTYCEMIETAIRRLLHPIRTPQPDHLILNLSTDETGLTWRDIVEESTEGEPFPQIINDLTLLQDSETFAKQQSQRRALVEQWEQGLSQEKAVEFSLPWSSFFGSVIQHDLPRASQWLDWILEVNHPALLKQVYNPGISLAGAFSSHDGPKAAKVFAHLREHESFVRVALGEEAIPLYLHALFVAPDEESLNTLREEYFLNAPDDSAIEIGVLAAEINGASSWLNRFVNRLRESRHPADHALGLTIAGFRVENALSDLIFAQAPEPGFLGDVRSKAGEAYLRSSWTRHWIQQALEALHPSDLWRFGLLAEKIADWRFACDFERYGRNQSSPFRMFSGELYSRLVKAAQARRKKRESTLFGMDMPGNDVLQMIAKSRLQF